MKSLMKKISVLLASAMLLGSLTACDNGKWKTEAQAALPAAFDDASVGKIYCQGEVINFPLKVSDKYQGHRGRDSGVQLVHRCARAFFQEEFFEDCRDQGTQH